MAAACAAGCLCLQLDVTSLLGRTRVASVDGERVRCREHLITCTGYLHRRAAAGRRRRAQHGGGGAPELRLESALAVAPGAWVSAVDYVIGDEVAWTPTVSG